MPWQPLEIDDDQHRMVRHAIAIADAMVDLDFELDPVNKSHIRRKIGDMLTNYRYARLKVSGPLQDALRDEID